MTIKLIGELITLLDGYERASTFKEKDQLLVEILSVKNKLKTMTPGTRYAVKCTAFSPSSAKSSNQIGEPFDTESEALEYAKQLNKLMNVYYVEPVAVPGFYEENEIKLVESKLKDYKQIAKAQIGETFKDDYCNGFFGSRNFDLAGARITRIYEVENNDDELEIVVEIQYKNGKYDYGYFLESYANWKSVAEHLEQWITTEMM